MTRARFTRAVILPASLLFSAGVLSLERASLHLPRLEGEAWTLKDVQLTLGLPASSGMTGHVTIQTLELAASGETLSGIEVNCGRLAISQTALRCQEGRFQVADWRGQPARGRLELVYDRTRQALKLELDSVQAMSGRLHAQAQYADGNWSVRLQGEGIALTDLIAVSGIGPSLPYSLSRGRIDIEGELHGSRDRFDRVQAEMGVSDLAFSNASGLVAGEGLAARLELNANHQKTGWKGDFDLNARAGGLYVDPVYTEFTQHPLQATGGVKVDSNTQNLTLTDVELQQQGVIRAKLQGGLNWQQDVTVNRADIDIDRLDMAGFYPTYVAPWLAGTAFSDLTASGQLSGTLAVRDNSLSQFDLQLAQVDIRDPQARLSLQGLAGNLAWGRDNTAHTMQIGWQSGSLYRFDLGQADLRLQSRGEDYRLLEPAEIGLLDGTLMIDEWSLSHPGADNMQWRINAILTPVSMQKVTDALQWPQMQGRLSGVIPDVRYADGRVEVGGMLLVRAFDGSIKLQNVSLDQPLGLVPQLYADISLENIDLEQLTGTFSFGKIEGRLDGRIDNLWLQNWEPVAFDGRLATPKDDESRHRISQKAVDNLSRIGGGVGQALSQTFLGLFEEFPYDRLGISCRLHNGICDMGGVAPAEQGYYLVKGTWLPPRINVIGYADQVDWDALVARIEAATTGGAPQIQ